MTDRLARSEAGLEKPAIGVSRRLLGRLLSHRAHLIAIVLAALGGVVASAVVAPRVLGYATDLIFAGVISSQLPSGATAEEALAQLRAEGNDSLATVFSTVDIVPGAGVDFDRLGGLLMILLVLYISSSVLLYVQARLATLVVGKVALKLREQVAAKLTRLPLSYFDRHPRGELQSRLTNDVDNVQQVLQQTMESVVAKVFTVIGAAAMMFVVSPVLAVVVLATLPLSGLVVAWAGKRAERRFTEQWSATGGLNAYVEEIYRAQHLVTVFGRRQQVRRSFDERNERVFASGVRGQISSASLEPLVVLLSNINSIVIMVVGALRVISGSLSIGDVQSFVQYNGNFGSNVGVLAGIVGKLQSGLASAARVFELLDADEEKPEPPSMPGSARRPSPVREAKPVRGRVRFDRVRFRYSPRTPLIEDLTYTIEPGQTVAVVGATGAGKTTLANLLMRFYELDGGRILVDGVDIATMSRADVRRMIGLVPQEPWLFEGTVAGNIVYGRQGATRDEVVAAARAARVDAFVRTLPDGYDTLLDDSAQLSAGERQLVAIARAFLADPAILILDEATSSVDTRSDVLVQRAMKSLGHGRTSLVIAHRLSTIRDADAIIVMESGRIVEHGTHEHLLNANGRYAHLYRTHENNSPQLLRRS